jgi:hypothetical protein
MNLVGTLSLKNIGPGFRKTPGTDSLNPDPRRRQNRREHLPGRYGGSKTVKFFTQRISFNEPKNCLHKSGTVPVHIFSVTKLKIGT